MLIESTELALKINEQIRVLSEKCDKMDRTERIGYRIALVDMLEILSEDLLTL